MSQITYRFMYITLKSWGLWSHTWIIKRDLDIIFLHKGMTLKKASLLCSVFKRLHHFKLHWTYKKKTLTQMFKALGLITEPKVWAWRLTTVCKDSLIRQLVDQKSITPQLAWKRLLVCSSFIQPPQAAPLRRATIILRSRVLHRALRKTESLPSHKNFLFSEGKVKSFCNISQDSPFHHKQLYWNWETLSLRLY